MGNLTTRREQVRMIGANVTKAVAYRTGLHRILFYRYDYMFRPIELAFLVECLTATTSLPGPIFEIGCAGGHTTVYLNKHLDDLDDDRRFVCLDTFGGFTDDDIAAEEARGKDPRPYRYVFRAYRKEWFDRTVHNNGVNRVISIKTDANTFDFSPYHDISFCLIDVDLKRPVERCLDELIPRMAPGGIIVVDDCAPDNKFDGALAAYMETMQTRDQPVEIVNDMLGVLRIPAS